ncbi:MAG: SDR family oxidoreductase [Blastomonas sp.]
MSGSLAGQVAIVTGGSRGMGRRFVDAMVGAGAKVAAIGRSGTDLDAVGAKHGDAVLPISCDISDSAAVRKAVDQVAGHFGRLDAIVNNAAIFEPFLMEKATDEIVHRHVDINIKGVVWLIREAIPHLKASKGQIVSITSESVRMPYPMLALYAATKAAVETLSGGLRDELRADDIRVAVLRSGAVSGSSGSQNWSPEIQQVFYETIVRTGHASFSGASATPESMAEALVALLTMPRDVNIDLMEVRAAASGSPIAGR